MGAKHLAQAVVEDVGSRVVALDGDTRLLIDLGNYWSCDVGRQFLDNVYGEVVLALGVDDLDCFAFAEDEHTLVAHLSAHFAVEWCLFEHDLVEGLVLLLDAAVAQYFGLGFEEIVAHKVGGACMEFHPVAVLDGSSVACTFLLSLHIYLEALLVDGQRIFACDEFGEVEWESESVEEREGILAVNHGVSAGLGVGHDVLKTLDATCQGTQETVFLLLDDLHDEFVLGLQFGIGIAHGFDEHGEQLVEEGILLAEIGVGITYSTAQDATNHITCLGVAGQLTVGDGKGDGADMVCDYAHGHVGLLVLAIGVATEGTDHLDDGLEDVSVVVRGLVLQCAYQALEAHTCVDHVGRQFLKAAISLAVVLHEDEVPDFDYLRMVFVHKLTARCRSLFGLRAAVVVNLRAGAAGTCVAHLPEVIVLVAIEDVILRQETLPDGGSLVVTVESFLFRTLEDGGVHVLRVEVQLVNQVFPCPRDGFLLEVVAERPVAEHLEHRVVVGVVSNLLQVVVLAAHAQTFLAVGGTAELLLDIAENNILELVHTSIRKHQGGVALEHHRSRWYDGAALRSKELQEALADFFCSHHFYFVLYFIRFMLTIARKDMKYLDMMVLI